MRFGRAFRGAPAPPPERPPLEAERRELLPRLEARLEAPMLVLGFVRLALLILEFTRGLFDFPPN